MTFYYKVLFSLDLLWQNACNDVCKLHIPIHKITILGIVYACNCLVLYIISAFFLSRTLEKCHNLFKTFMEESPLFALPHRLYSG